MPTVRNLLVDSENIGSALRQKRPVVTERRTHMKSILSIIVMVLIPCFAMQYACAIKRAPATGESPALYILRQSGELCEGAREEARSRPAGNMQLNSSALPSMVCWAVPATQTRLFCTFTAGRPAKKRNRTSR